MDYQHKLREPAEQKFYQVFINMTHITNPAIINNDYVTYLRAQATLKQPIDEYFDNIMVNVDDEELRIVRLTQLQELHVVMNRIADLSKLAS